MSNVEKWLEQFVGLKKYPPEKVRTLPKEELIKEPPRQDVEEALEKKELEDDFKQQVEVAAYYLWRDGYSYNDLCWFLAEKILKRTYKLGTPLSIQDTSKKAEEIHNHSISYEELCWLTAEMDIIIKKYFDK